jgi:flagellar export protein FliJ
MKPFRFSLQPLRVLREQTERTAQQRYAEALRDCEAAAARVEAAGTELANAWKRLRQQLTAGLTANDLMSARAWINVLEFRLRERTNELEAARQVVDAAWQELMHATRDREALDHFHDKRRRQYDRAVLQEEQKNLDELAVQRAEAATPFRFAPTFTK